MIRASPHLQGSLAAASGALCWSLDGLLLRIVDANAWQALFWRLSSFTLAVVCVLVWRERVALRAAFRRMGAPGLLVGLLLAAVNGFFLFSITLTAVANTLVLFATVPIFGAVFGWVFLREPLRLRTGIAITVGIAGIAAIFAETLQQGSVIGDLFAVIAALLFAGNLTVIRAHPKMPLLPPLVLAGILASVIAALFSHPFDVSSRDMALLVVSGATQQTAGLLLFQWGARFLPPAEVGLLAFVETVFGPLWVWLGVGEVPTAMTLMSGTIIVITLVGHSSFALYEERRSIKSDDITSKR